MIFRFKPAPNPRLKKATYDAIARFELRNAGADRHDFTGSIRAWYSA
jgi:hypothetical protein